MKQPVAEASDMDFSAALAACYNAAKSGCYGVSLLLDGGC